MLPLVGRQSLSLKSICNIFVSSLISHMSHITYISSQVSIAVAAAVDSHHHKQQHVMYRWACPSFTNWFKADVMFLWSLEGFGSGFRLSAVSLCKFTYLASSVRKFINKYALEKTAANRFLRRSVQRQNPLCKTTSVRLVFLLSVA
jgi:hypothetical protein